MSQVIVERLISKGVNIPNPGSVYVADDVDPDRISPDNVTIYTGCKIAGKKTLIMKNSTIGYEAPVSLENCLMGESCQLKGGFFQDAVFLGQNQFGSGAHVRGGTILEEQANAAHTVGLKQTILFPFVTLGSLINFCDCFMAGGTSRKNHSEVGSSFIHFNYTPNQDKATPSMMGDVHQGVMLKSNPIFLGGQGGLVGPVRIAYGCISAAGSILRKNEIRENHLIFGGAFKEMSIPKQPMVYRNISHIFNNNIQYIAALLSLKTWYHHVRSLYADDFLSKELLKGVKEMLDSCISERIKRFEIFGSKLKESKKILLAKSKDPKNKLILLHDKALRHIEMSNDVFKKALEIKELSLPGEKFVGLIEKKIKGSQTDYITTIQHLTREEQEKGSQWLYDVESAVSDQLLL